MSDQETLAVYSDRIDDYVDCVGQYPCDPGFEDFVAWLDPGDRVLDWGCGPGGASAALRERGLQVDPVDACAAMVEQANRQFDLGARQASFDELDAVAEYDAVWANFSLLHAPAARFPQHLRAAFAALRDGGVLHLGMKRGSGEHRDALGRFYCYYEEAELVGLLESAGFVIDEVGHGEGRGLAGGVEPWIVVLACKPL